MLILIFFIPFILVTILMKRNSKAPKTKHLCYRSILITLPICAIIYALAIIGCNEFYKSCDTVVTDKQTIPLCDSGEYYLRPISDGYEYYEQSLLKNESDSIAPYVTHTVSDSNADIIIKTTNKTPYCKVIKTKINAPKWLHVLAGPMLFYKISERTYTFYLPK